MVEFRAAIKILDPRFEGPRARSYLGWSKYSQSKHDEADREYRDGMDQIFQLVSNYRGKWPWHIDDRVRRELNKYGDLLLKLHTETQYQPNSGPYRALSRFELDFVKWLFMHGAVQGEITRFGLDIPRWFSRKVTERAKRIFESNPDNL